MSRKLYNFTKLSYTNFLELLPIQKNTCFTYYDKENNEVKYKEVKIVLELDNILYCFEKSYVYKFELLKPFECAYTKESIDKYYDIIQDERDIFENDILVDLDYDIHFLDDVKDFLNIMTNGLALDDITLNTVENTYDKIIFNGKIFIHLYNCFADLKTRPKKFKFIKRKKHRISNL